MQSSINRHSAKSDSPSTPHDRKRKRSNRHSASEDSTRHQPTLPALLSSQQKLHTDTLDRSPLGKRTKRPSEVPLTCPPVQARTSTDMYSFTSRSPSGNGHSVIDLTQDTLSLSPQTHRISGGLKTRSSLNPHTGAKKLVVKNLKTNTTWDSKAYLEKIWAQLDEALAVILKDASPNFSKEELYRGAENVSRQGGASTLFSRLDVRCRTHMEHDVRALLLTKAQLQSDNVTLLRAVIEQWARWKNQMATVRAIFFFMDRSYLLSSKKPTLSELTIRLFREIVFEDDHLKSKIVDGVCDLVSTDRMQEDGPGLGLLQDAVKMLHELSVYTSSFEPRFLATSQRYFTDWSQRMIEDQTLPDYVNHAQALIAREMWRCDSLALDTSTKRNVLALLEEHLIETKQRDLVEYDAVAELLNNNARSDLAALYGLLHRVRLGKELRPSFEKWVEETGTSIIFSKDEDNMVVHLLSLKSSLDETWSSSFQRDESIGHGLRESFEIFMNKTKKGEATWGTDNAKIGEMIAKYVNQLLRGGAKAIPELLTARRASGGTSIPAEQRPAVTAAEDNKDSDVDEDAEINTQLDQVLDLFRFLRGKAVFEAFYKKDLARRLLMARSASADAERSMLTRLKTECGSGFTQNLEQMFKDIELAREEMQAYKQMLEDRVGHEKGRYVDLNVNTLSAAAWPTYPEIPVVVPENVKRALDDFELHYKSKHSGRRLEWKHALAHCQLKATFGKVNKELVVSSFQAIVLLLFNGLADGERLTYNHIQTETGLPEADIKRTLQSLACASLRPLTKHPKGKDINHDDAFSVNVDFTHPKYRVKINQVQLKETKEENKETHIRVAEDRNFECQAAIVRILKSRKTIGHQELISETIKATMSRGVLAVADIKKNIDRLIEKDYMEREDGNMYTYLA